jgi:hypothetical protein
VDNIDPAAVEAGLNIAANFAIEKGAPAPAEDGQKGPRS